MVGNYNAESIEALLNLDAEERTLEDILEANDKNKQQLAVYNNQISISITALERLLVSYPEGSELIDIERLQEPEYVSQKLTELLDKFQRDKAEFNQYLNKAKEVLNI